MAEFVAAEFDWAGTAAVFERAENPSAADWAGTATEGEGALDEVVECVWELVSTSGTKGLVIARVGDNYNVRRDWGGLLDYQGPVCVGDFVAGHPALSDGVVVHNANWGMFAFAVPPDTEWLTLSLSTARSQWSEDWTTCEGSITYGGVASDDYEPQFLAVADRFLEELGWSSQRG